MTLKINIDDEFLSFMISKGDKDLDWTELDKIEQIKIITAICSAYGYFSKLYK